MEILSLYKAVVLAAALGIFAGTIVFVGPHVKSEYFPKSDSDRISAVIQLPVGTSQDITREMAHEIYAKIEKAVPEMKSTSYTLGQADAEDAFASAQDNGTHIISFSMNIGSMEDRDRSCSEIADVIRGIFAEYPDLTKVEVTEGAAGMGGASTVDVEIYGHDFETTDRIARLIQNEMIEAGGCSQVLLSRDEYTPEYQVDFDRVKLAINGLNSTTAAAQLSSAMSGSVMSYYREDGDEYDIRVRYAPEFRTSTEDIENILVYNQMGKGIRIRDLGKVIESQVPPTIERKDRERVITISGVVADGYALSDVVTSTESIIESTEIPSELSVRIGGSYEDQQETFGQLGMLLIIIIVLVYIVMASQFESLMSPFVIMFSIPFAFVGVIIGLAVTDTPLGVMALIGILILMGIVVKNGIVLIDYTILMQERGYSVKEATVMAAKSRLRPILMTTLTTVLGMLPMALGTGEGSEMWRSLGMTVAWGLSISSLVTLVIIPTLYCAFQSRRERRTAKRLTTSKS